MILMPNDLIRVYSKGFNAVKQVGIYGSVRNPGYYELKSMMTIKDLILESGGLVVMHTNLG